jgi:hypothetical protein
MKYQARYEILATILEVASSDEDTSRATIMYKSFLSHAQLYKTKERW